MDQDTVMASADPAAVAGTARDREANTAQSLDPSGKDEKKETQETQETKEQDAHLGLDTHDATSSVGIVLVSKTGEKFQTTKQKAYISNLIKTMIEGDPTETELPVPGVDRETLHEIVLYMDHHQGKEPPIVEKPLQSRIMKDVCKDAWDAEFIDRICPNRDLFYKVILGANFMEIQGLLHLGIAKMASLIKGEDMDKITDILDGVSLSDKPKGKAPLSDKPTGKDKKKKDTSKKSQESMDKEQDTKQDTKQATDTDVDSFDLNSSGSGSSTKSKGKGKAKAKAKAKTKESHKKDDMDVEKEIKETKETKETKKKKATSQKKTSNKSQEKEQEQKEQAKPVQDKPKKKASTQPVSKKAKISSQKAVDANDNDDFAPVPVTVKKSTMTATTTIEKRGVKRRQE